MFVILEKRTCILSNGCTNHSIDLYIIYEVCCYGTQSLHLIGLLRSWLSIRTYTHTHYETGTNGYHALPSL